MVIEVLVLRGLIYGGADYAVHSNDEMLKFAMIETKRIFR